MSPAPTPRHQRLVKLLLYYFEQYLEQRGGGEVLGAPLDIVLSDVDVVQPDVLFISAGRLSIIEKQRVAGAPDLLIEIISESGRRRDEVIKKRRYEAFGVGEYWIVDPEIESIKVYRLHEGKYAKPVELSVEESDVVTTPLLPGLQIRLDRLFSK